MDDSSKEFIDLIKHLLMDQLTGSGDEKKKGGVPSVIGVKFVVGGSAPSGLGSLGDIPKMPKRQLPLELFEDDTTYTLQTELPGSCTEFAIEFSDGKLHLKTGHDNEYSAEIPLSPIIMEKTESHLRNGVLEIVCYKQQQ